eukprot:scaffold383_cov20-Cyclotella_meneghiniana.AAC.2
MARTSPNENGILSHISKINIFQQRLSLYPKKRQPPAGRMPLNSSREFDLKSAQFEPAVPLEGKGSTSLSHPSTRHLLCNSRSCLDNLWAFDVTSETWTKHQSYVVPSIGRRVIQRLPKQFPSPRFQDESSSLADGLRERRHDDMYACDVSEIVGPPYNIFSVKAADQATSPIVDVDQLTVTGKRDSLPHLLLSRLRVPKE